MVNNGRIRALANLVRPFQPTFNCGLVIFSNPKPEAERNMYITLPIYSSSPKKILTGNQLSPQTLKKGWSVLPKSVTKSRIEGNFELDGWDLTDEEVAKIDAIPDRFKVCGDSWLPVKIFFGDDE